MAGSPPSSRSGSADLRAVIVRGAGASFCSGADLKLLETLDVDAARGFMLDAARSFRRLSQLPVPIIAAIHGYCMGGGFELMLHCDVVVAQQDAVFGLPEVSLGLITTAGAMARLQDAVGSTRARDILLTGRRLSAGEAHRIGLLAYVDGDLDRALSDIVSSLPRAPRSVALAKRLLADLEAQRHASSWVAEVEGFEKLLRHGSQVMSQEDGESRVAMVTGASRGIGRAIAVALADLGATIAVHYASDEDAAQQTRRLALDKGATAVSLWRADLRDGAAAAKVVGDVISEHGRLDILVNNAGIQRSAMAHKMSDGDWHDVLALNLSAAFFTSRAALVSMRAARSGHIVNIASASSFVGQVGAASYVASKHGLIGLTKALAAESVSRGIQVNAVAPGLTATDLTSGLSEPQLEGLLAIVPMKRLAAPEEVAAMVKWVVTGATYSTGNVFHVTGGTTMG